jgi:hypothetical protein
MSYSDGGWREAALRKFARLHGHDGSELRTSILELQGLGKEIWRGVDARGYVNYERSS